MRTHRKYSPLTCWRDQSQLEDLVDLRHLAAARLEPIVRGLRGGCMLDLVFCAGERVAVVPFIEIAPEMLVQREASPFVWPHEAAQAVSEDAAAGVESALLPWVESLTLARQLNAETVRFFGDAAARELFAAAREAAFLGARPYADVLKDAAPYLYAVRFAENRRICVRDPQGACGSALLSRHAREVRADLGEARRNEVAQRWFGKALFGALDANASYDVAICPARHDAAEADVRIVLDGPRGEDGAIVEVATPVPTDVMLSFDPQDAPICRTFSVHVRTPQTLRPSLLAPGSQASGGSAGRILFVMRDDYARVPDADTDEAEALASLLRAEGFSVDLAPASAALPAAYDLVHAFTLARVNELAAPLAAAQSAGTPVVLTPFLQDVSAQGAWGTGIMRALLRVAADETDLEDNLALLEQRRLEGPGLSAKRQEPVPGYDAAVRTALQRAGAVLTASAEEERLVRAFGYTGLVMRCGPCLPAREAASAQTCAGTGDFVFAHAPLEARSNLLLLVRAAIAARVPLIAAGPVVEPEYVLALREQADERVVILAEPDAATAEALYRRARVYADVSWAPFGTHRALRAAASGAAVVAAKGGPVPSVLGNEGIWEADPASQASIAIALGDAWMHARERRDAVDSAARRAASLGDARGALLAAVQAYAAAQQPRTLA